MKKGKLLEMSRRELLDRTEKLYKEWGEVQKTWATTPYDMGSAMLSEAMLCILVAHLNRSFDADLNLQGKSLKKHTMDSLIIGFSSLGLNEETKSLNLIIETKGKLDKILATYANTKSDLVDKSKIKKKADDIFMQGIQCLGNVLEIAQQPNPSGIVELRKENKELLDDMKNTKEGSPLYSLIEEKLGKNYENIKLIKDKENRKREYIMQANLCIDTLRGISLQIPEVAKHKSREEFDATVAELQVRK